ncbi:helix-hairpin-helix domain-containing protein [Sorangium sp. So ce1182]|uniref:helix-hairpin-helix domain-containing protein n=1 Tax=Sorangium sp. So ce1182 TaxID=3133334 RepID=UPI003F5D9274
MAKGPRDAQIDLNKATAEELEAIEGIDGERARLIIEHRSERGTFRSWADVLSVPGIDGVLLGKLQEGSSLGAAARSPAAGAGAAARGGAETASGAATAPRAAGEGEIGDMTALEQIIGLILLDMAAAEAYRVAIGACKTPEIRRQLEAFRGDHERHARELSDALGASLPEQRDERGQCIQRYTELSAREDRTALVAMRGNEELTNDAYASALASDLPDDVRRMVEANWQDERRHIRWINEEIRTRGWELPEVPSTLAEAA